MEILDNKNIRTTIIVSLLIITAVFLHHLLKQSESLLIYQSAGILRAIIYFGLFIVWGLSIQQRIIQKQTHFYLLFITILMIYWVLARTMRYFFVIENLDLYHLLWYSYYIPMLFIPLISLFMALHLGKNEDYRLPKWTNLLYIPTILLIGLVLTNDLHQVVFAFPPENTWGKMDYHYKIGYWLVFAWTLLCAFVALAIFITKSRVPRSKRILWLPFIPLLIYVAYALLYAIRQPIIHALIGDMTAVFCLLIMAIFESCTQVGLIRSNTNYAQLFHASDIAAQIVDKDYRVFYRSEKTPLLSVDIMRQAQNRLVELDKDTRLSSIPITGGYTLWVEDISTMNQLLSDLQEAGSELAENNDLLQAELELKERQAIIDEKNRLYDKVAKEAAPQLNILNKLLAPNSPNSMSLREKLTWLIVLGAYVKRRSNLIISSEDRNTLYARELEFCFRESVQALTECGIPSFFNRRCEGSLPTKEGFLIYDFFEEIIELSLPSLESLLVNLTINLQYLELKLQLDCDVLPQSIKELNNYLYVSQLTTLNLGMIDDSLNINLSLPLGGGA